MDATDTNRDMLYRAFGLMTARDLYLLSDALRHHGQLQGTITGEDAKALRKRDDSMAEIAIEAAMEAERA
jgi:hypothetical protein